MNRIQTIIQKFDFNPCTLSFGEMREYLYFLQDELRPFKRKAEQNKYPEEILKRLQIVEIFYDALAHNDNVSWLDFDKLYYSLQNSPENLDINELTVLNYYLVKKIADGIHEADFETTLLQVRAMLKAYH